MCEKYLPRAENKLSSLCSNNDNDDSNDDNDDSNHSNNPVTDYDCVGYKFFIIMLPIITITNSCGKNTDGNYR